MSVCVCIYFLKTFKIPFILVGIGLLQLNPKQVNRLHVEVILTNDLEKISNSINHLNCLQFLVRSSKPFQFKKLFKCVHYALVSKFLKNPQK